MTLAEHQVCFTTDVARLIVYANSIPSIRIRLGECQRDRRIAILNEQEGKGVSHSLHLDSLAIDVRLDKLTNGKWIYQTETCAYEEIGKFWKSLDPANRWGGDFQYPGPDGNHFSRTPDGIRG